MANLKRASVREALNMGLGGNTEILQTVGATSTLIKALHMIDSLVAPKHFCLIGAYLRRFEAVDNGFSRHSLKIEGEKPIDEISEWQVVGTAGDRIVNVIALGVFHTHQHNRSGNHEYSFNGKPYLRPEYGGITRDDIWQESGLYKQFNGASPIGISLQNRQGKITRKYH